MQPFSDTTSAIPLHHLYQLTLALGLGLFVGLEREWRGKEAGLRTFGFAALIGGMGGFLGQSYAMVCLALLGILVIFLNVQSLKANQGTELTTSAALLITGLSGVLCGLGHRILPAAVTVTTAGLLTYKERLAGFSHDLTGPELRAAILLGILTFAIYPILPQTPIDPWGLIIPFEAWTTVILISSIGFINYLLWKIYGRKGIELTGFLGGLVNSTVSVTELSNRMREVGEIVLDPTYRGVLLATIAMAIRNGVLLVILAPQAFQDSSLPLFLILISCGAFAHRNSVLARKRGQKDALILPLTSPFSLYSALKFGMIFLMLHVIGAVAQSYAGQGGFYLVSMVGGLISSASAVASAGSLARHGQLTTAVAGMGAVLASLSSAAMNFILVTRYSKNTKLTQELTKALGTTLFLAILGAFIQLKLL